MSDNVFFTIEDSENYGNPIDYIRDKGRAKGLDDDVLAEAYVILEEEALKSADIHSRCAEAGFPTRDIEQEANISSNTIDYVLEELDKREEPRDIEEIVHEANYERTISVSEEVVEKATDDNLF